MDFRKSTEAPLSPASTIEHSQHPTTTSTLQPQPPSELLMMAESNTDSKKVHDEKHSDYGDIVRDLIIGFADGLTVPFALTAGLSSWAIHSFSRISANN
jgi:hypothetical protein